MTTTDGSPISMVYLFVAIFISKPVLDLIYSTVDYTDKVSLSVFLICTILKIKKINILTGTL